MKGVFKTSSNSYGGDFSKTSLRLKGIFYFGKTFKDVTMNEIAGMSFNLNINQTLTLT